MNSRCYSIIVTMGSNSSMEKTKSSKCCFWWLKSVLLYFRIYLIFALIIFIDLKCVSCDSHKLSSNSSSVASAIADLNISEELISSVASSVSKPHRLRHQHHQKQPRKEDPKFKIEDSSKFMQADSAYKDEAKRPCEPLPNELLRKIMGPAFNPRYMSIEKPELDAHDLPKSNKPGQQDQAAWREPRPKVESFRVHAGYSRILHDEPLMYDWNGIDTPSEQPKATTEPAEVQREHRPQTWRRPTVAKTDPATPADKIKQDIEARLKVDRFEQSEPPQETPKSVRQRPTPADKFVKSIRGKRDLKSGFPWFCESQIKWIDLGNDHFPRFLRSVVCTGEKCWFGHFQCQPKAFTVKILRRRKDSCVPSTNNDNKPSDDGTFQDEQGLSDANSRVPNEFREQWVFEERSVTFCCECAA